MTKEEAYTQYEYEVALFEQWGDTNNITFDEWLQIKGIDIETKSDTPKDLEEAMELADKFEKGYEAGVYDTKNKILRWAMEHKKAIEVNGDESDPYARGEYSVFLALIDKIHLL